MWGVGCGGVGAGLGGPIRVGEVGEGGSSDGSRVQNGA